MAESHLRKGSTSIAIRKKMQIKTTLIFYLTPILNDQCQKHRRQLTLERLWHNGNTPSLPVGVESGPATLDITMEFFQNIRK